MEKPHASLYHSLLLPVPNSVLSTCSLCPCLSTLIPLRRLRTVSHPTLLSALQQQRELPPEPPPPMPPSGPSSVWGSFRRRGRGTGAHPSLLCCLSLPLPLPLLPRVTFHPSLGCPSKAAPVVNNFGWQPHTKPGPETIVPGTMAKQPNNEAATVLSDILRCPGKGGGAVGFAMPAPPGVELFPLRKEVPFSEETPGTCRLQSPSFPVIACWVLVIQRHPSQPIHTTPALAPFSTPKSRVRTSHGLAMDWFWQIHQGAKLTARGLTGSMGYAVESVCSGALAAVGSRFPSSCASCVTFGKRFDLSESLLIHFRKQWWDGSQEEGPGKSAQR